MPIKLNSDAGGSVTLDVPSTPSVYKLTIPASNGTFAIVQNDGVVNFGLNGITFSNSVSVSNTLSITGNATFSNTVTTSNNVIVGGTVSMGSSFKRNRIINGNMLIDQRNAGAQITAANLINNTYMVDRWWYFGYSAKFTAQQNAGAVTPPVGFSNYLGMTVASAYTVTTSDAFGICQHIEGFNFADLAWGTTSAKTITLSFQVYSSLTGTFGGALRNGVPNRSYPFSYSIPIANTWTTISVTIPGETSGTWVGATNGVGLGVIFNLGTGSTYSTTAGAWAAGNYVAPTGAVSVVGTAGATFYITGVQLESGTIATPYERQIYSDQLAQCQRYYQKIYAMTGGSGNSGNFYCNVQFPVTMRATPNFSLSGPLNVTDPAVASYTQSLADVTVVGGQNNTGAYLKFANFSGINSYRTLMANDFSNYLIASAEL
jgi:hypothetical protein